MDLRYERLEVLLLLTGAWTGLFLLLRYVLCKARSALFSNRLVSFLHAFVAIYFTFVALDLRHPFKDYGTRSKPLEIRALSISLGYFIYDTFSTWLLESDAANTAHHACTVVAVAVGVLQGTDGAELTECLLLMEISNPFLHARYFLKELGYSKTNAATWNDVLFAVTFFICRLVVGPFITFYTLVCPTSSIIVKVGGSGIQIVSCVWFYKIVRMAMRRMRYDSHGEGNAAK